MDTENKYVVTRGEGVGENEWNKWRRFRGTKYQLEKKMSHEAEMHSMGNITNGIVIALYGDVW